MSLLFQWTARYLQTYVELPEEQIAGLLEHPPRPELGDAAFPCFALSRTLKKAPAAIAAELAARMANSSEGVEVQAVGPYVNLSFDPAQWSLKLLDSALSDSFGSSKQGEGKRVVIDMSSPNIAKPFGVGHLRSTMIGNAIANLYRSSGYDVVTVNHIGDWGTQFGKLMEAYVRWGDDEALKAEPIKESLRLYVRFHDEAEQDNSLEDAARRWFWKLENGDAEARRLWQQFVAFSMTEFERVYDRLGVSFDYTLGESFYNDKMDAVVQRLEELGLLEESDGARVVRLDDLGMPPCLILKSDGTTIYPTRDLATALYRKREMAADRMLYVVGAEQTLHFKQVFAVLERMGEHWASDCEHLPFGLMKIEGRKMSTRRGQVVFLDDVLDEAAAKAEAIIADKNPDLPNQRETAEAIGIGAIVFGDLLHNRLLEVDFSLDEALRFEGETGPYVQYTAARAYKLLAKGGVNPESRAAGIDAINGRFLASPSAWELLKGLAMYPDVLADALRVHEPSVLARYLVDTAKRFNRFYHHERVIAEAPDETAAKLALTAAALRVMRAGLSVLGLKSPNQI